MVEAMEIGNGFKKTEAGIFPSDWNVLNLRKLISEKLQNGVFYKPSKKGRGIKLINVGDLYKGFPINIKELELFDALVDEEKRFKVINGDVFFTRSSVVPSGIAHCNIYVSDVAEKVVFDSHVIKARPDTKIINSLYFYRFCSFVARNYLISHAKSAIMTTIDQGVIDKCPIAFPPTKAEQTAIANALNDADALINQLEQLLTKKRNIKTGAMQELLKPKEGWEKKTLGEVADVVGGGTPSTFNSKYWNGGINWFTPTEIGYKKYSFQSIRKITNEGLKNCSARMLPIGTILLTSRASIGDVSILMEESCTNQGFQSLITKTENNNEFLYYLILTLKPILLQNASGSTFLEISPSKLKSIDVSIPKLKEQTRIAQILSDMDTEIQELERKLEKYKMLKQGMMQSLLTGKIRLV